MKLPDFPRALRDAAFQQQLNVVVTVGVLFFALSSSLLTAWQGSRQIRDTLLQQGVQITENLARQSGLALLYASPDNAQDGLRNTLAFPDVKRVEVLLIDGAVLAASGKHDMTACAAPTLDARARTAYLDADTSEAWCFVAPVLVQVDTSQLDAMESKDELLGFVRVLQSKETLARMLLGIFSANLAISLLFAFVLLFVLRQLSHRLTQPIMALSATMARAEHGDMTVRAGLDGPKDIVDMASAFNSMIGSLQDREKLTEQVRAAKAAHAETRIIAEREHAEREHQRRFLAMLTHELKTPLSVIRMRLGTAQPSSRMEAHADNAIADIDAIIERVALTTRIDDHTLEQQQHPCRLNEILIEICAHHPQPTRERVDLACAAEDMRLMADPVLLRIAIGNLLDNALKYAPPEARVRVHAANLEEQTQPGILVRIENPMGPAGRPDPARVFEKYYRTPGAHMESGSGLGLYIVQEIAGLMGGRIRYLADCPEVCFELWLPRGNKA